MSSNIPIESPMQKYHGQRSGKADAGVLIVESSIAGNLILRGNPSDRPFIEAVKETLGVDLPTDPCTVSRNSKVTIYWLGPTEWLLITAIEDCDVYRVGLESLAADHFAVVDVTGGQTIFTLTGVATESVLKKSSHYDFHSSSFDQGRCVQTTFAKATAIVRRSGEGEFMLIVRRSFADYIASWLIDAGEEFGCEIRSENHIL